MEARTYTNLSSDLISHSFFTISYDASSDMMTDRIEQRKRMSQWGNALIASVSSSLRDCLKKRRKKIETLFFNSNYWHIDTLRRTSCGKKELGKKKVIFIGR